MGAVEQLLDLISMAAKLGELTATDQRELAEKFLKPEVRQQSG